MTSKSADKWSEVAFNLFGFFLSEPFIYLKKAPRANGGNILHWTLCILSWLFHLALQILYTRAAMPSGGHTDLLHMTTPFCIWSNVFQTCASFTACALRVRLCQISRKLTWPKVKDMIKLNASFFQYHQCISGISSQMRTKNQSTRQLSKRRPSTLNSMK